MAKEKQKKGNAPLEVKEKSKDGKRQMNKKETVFGNVKMKRRWWQCGGKDKEEIVMTDKRKQKNIMNHWMNEKSLNNFLIPFRYANCTLTSVTPMDRY